MTAVEELFLRAEQAGVDGSFIRIDASHPLGIFIGLEAGQRCVLLVCQHRPPVPPTIGALHMEIRLRGSGEWALTVRLERPDMSGLFARLVEDLVNSTLHTSKDPGAAFVNRIIRWQRLFARGPSTLLDDIELRGLIAELVFLVEEAIPHAGPETAVAAWVGPFEAPKDFVFPDREVEVKATSRQPSALHISSLEQLTDTGVPLYLWTKVVELERSNPDATRSAASWVRQARASCCDHAIASQALEDCLRAAGWEDRSEYEGCIIRVGATACYGVQDGFPRIQRTALPAGVLDGRYRLDAAALAGFLTPDWRAGHRDR